MPYTCVDSLGKCEHCEMLIDISDYAGSEGNEIWRCKHCGGEICHLSFGFNKPDTGCERVRWIGPDGKWTDKKPTESFELKGMTVSTQPRGSWMH